MVFCWPLSCMFWTIIAILILNTMADEIRFEHALTQTPYRWSLVVLLPYTLDMGLENKCQLGDLAISVVPKAWRGHQGLIPPADAPSGTNHANAVTQDQNCPTALVEENEPSTDEWCIRVIVQIPKNDRLAGWQVYDFIADFLGTVIYFMRRLYC